MMEEQRKQFHNLGPKPWVPFNDTPTTPLSSPLLVLRAREGKSPAPSPPPRKFDFNEVDREIRKSQKKRAPEPPVIRKDSDNSSVSSEKVVNVNPFESSGEDVKADQGTTQDEDISNNNHNDDIIDGRTCCILFARICAKIL